MEESSPGFIHTMAGSQRLFFQSQATKSIDFRLGNLKKLKKAVLDNEDKICEAVWLDLHKSKEEAYLTEISIVLQEIDSHIRHLRKWSTPRRVKTPVQLLPSGSWIYPEPLGTSLIFAPWNYPFQLLFCPLAGAIASGCCAVLKPSDKTPNTAKVMEKILSDIFSQDYVGCVQGGRASNQQLLEERFDIIFFTGSSSMGKVVMQAASRFLTPVVLELGGKSPCIVDAGSDIELAAQRIAWGKCINAGQTCIAPDYLFVHKSLKNQFVLHFAQAIEKMYGSDLKASAWYPRIVNDQAMERLQKLMLHGRILYGGEVDPSRKFIAPTLIDEVLPEYPIMQEEIFGPLLPVLTFENIDEVADYINGNEKPLAFYYFGRSGEAKKILGRTSSGGGCINDTLLHFANHHLPFGGVGNSGMSSYHGYESFKVFSNMRSIVSSPTWIDVPFKYPPFKYFRWVRKII